MLSNDNSFGKLQSAILTAFEKLHDTILETEDFHYLAAINSKYFSYTSELFGAIFKACLHWKEM